MKQQCLRYWLAMTASAFDAAVHAGVAFLGVAGAHAAFDAVPVLNWRQFAAVFLIAFGRAVLAYLEAHPLAALVPESAMASRASTAPRAADDAAGSTCAPHVVSCAPHETRDAGRVPSHPGADVLPGATSNQQPATSNPLP